MNKQSVALTIIQHLRQRGPNARVVVAAARQESLAQFQDEYLAQFEGELSQADKVARNQMTHASGGTIKFLSSTSLSRQYGPQWSMAVFDSSVGPLLTDAHVKDFRSRIQMGLRLEPYVQIEADEWQHEVQGQPLVVDDLLNVVVQGHRAGSEAA